MKIGKDTYDHIEIFDNTGQLIAMISDSNIVKEKNSSVHLCKTDQMFQGDSIDE